MFQLSETMQKILGILAIILLIALYVYMKIIAPVQQSIRQVDRAEAERRKRLNQ